ncbi:head vertex assembly chaperone [Vibrio phage F86]
MTPNAVKELVTEINEKVKFSILIDDVEVYVTDIIVDNNDRLKVEFVTQHPEREDEIRPHVEACIMKLISEEQKNEEQTTCKSNSRFSQIWSVIKNTLRP